jgi:PKD repeat protein
MRKVILVLIVVLAVILSIIGFFLIGPVFGTEEKEEPPLVAHIGTDKTKARIGEGFNFTAENSTGNILQYTWSFGDGNGSSGEKVYHSYNKPGWFNVTLTLKGSSSQSANTTIAVGTQMRDISVDRSEGVHRDLRPQWRSGIGFMNDIGPNIGQPVIEFNGDVTQAIGEFDLVIDVWIQRSANQVEIIDIYSDTFYGTGQNFQFSHTVSPSDIPIDCQKCPTQIRTSIWVDQGRWGSAEIHFVALFPL